MLSCTSVHARPHVDRAMLEGVTWAVLRGVRMFQRVHVDGSALRTVEPIPEHDVAAVCPARATVSLLSIPVEVQFPLKAAPSNFGTALLWWPGVDWGSFVLISWLAHAWLTGTPAGLQAYLDILPAARQDMTTLISRNSSFSHSAECRQLVAPIAAMCKVDVEVFCDVLLRTFALFRQHGLPMLSDGQGHPLFVQSPFAQYSGSLIALTPVLDLAAHSTNPNCELGFLDEQMVSSLAMDRAVDRHENYIGLQALRGIATGEALTIDRNAGFQLSAEAFENFFGFPLSAP